MSSEPRAPAGIVGAPWWLWLSVPIALLGIPGSVTGILVDRIYANETADWQTQAIGQDIANLVVLPVLLVLAVVAARGSVRALLAWAGTVVYAAYTYVIYAFAVHFGPLFLLYVAVLGLAVWALIGFFATIDIARVPTSPPGRLNRIVSAFLIVLAAGFALLWLSQDLPAIPDGAPPKELRDAGLLTNPVHVLDLALLLPATMLTGILLHRGHAWGQVLAPIVLSAMAGISLGIVSLMMVAIARGEEASLVVVSVLGLLGIVQAITCWRLLKSIHFAV
ncbi:hypothetical protein OHB24_35020 [Kribbella sp. NBC_00482]|uniref:hypothetical protein n=1 Tax=Kribbella sp. NBC_00482 TaxID=2975968 RepID=UPI002E187912